MHKEVLDEKGREIFTRLSQFQEFYLAGGTALALQVGHRISVDFDLFTQENIQQNLLERVEKIFKGESVVPSVNNSDELTVFLGIKKITFLYYPFPAVLDFVQYEGMRLLSIKEIAAAKAYSIGRRTAYRDYLDLYVVLARHHGTLQEIIDIAKQKYREEFHARLFLEQLIDVENLDDSGLILLDEKADKERLASFFRKEIGKIKLE